MSSDPYSPVSASATVAPRCDSRACQRSTRCSRCCSTPGYRWLRCCRRATSSDWHVDRDVVHHAADGHRRTRTADGDAIAIVAFSRVVQRVRPVVVRVRVSLESQTPAVVSRRWKRITASRRRVGAQMRPPVPVGESEVQDFRRHVGPHAGGVLFLDLDEPAVQRLCPAGWWRWCDNRPGVGRSVAGERAAGERVRRACSRCSKRCT